MDEEIHGFLKQLTLKMEEAGEEKKYRIPVEEVMDYCRNNRRTSIPEINVISTSILEIFVEIMGYLDYYEEEIEKSFAGALTTDEWNRIYNEVVGPFIEKIKSEESIMNQERRLAVISDFIERWLNFEKEEKEKILERGA